MQKILTLLVLITLLACNKDERRFEDEIETIEQYLIDNNLTAESTDEGLYYVTEMEGGTDKPNISSTVTAHYEGYYTDGDVFDSSYDRGEPADFPLQAVIRGWQIGIPKFGKGGKGILLIPSSLGYGSNPPSGIRNNAILIFDVEVIDF